MGRLGGSNCASWFIGWFVCLFVCLLDCLFFRLFTILLYWLLTSLDCLACYCWWKKSCTSWYVVYPITHLSHYLGVFYIPGSARFPPLTVLYGMACRDAQVQRTMSLCCCTVRISIWISISYMYPSIYISIFFPKTPVANRLGNR